MHYSSSTTYFIYSCLGLFVLCGNEGLDGGATNEYASLRSSPVISSTHASLMQARRWSCTRSLSRASLEPPKFNLGTLGMINSSGWLKTSRRFDGVRRYQKSLSVLRLLSTRTSKSKVRGANIVNKFFLSLATCPHKHIQKKKKKKLPR